MHARPPRRTLLVGDRLVNVAGESHYQEALLAICASEPGDEVRHEVEAVLVPEPGNPHDPNAVMVRIEDRLVGYLPRADAVAYGPMLEALAQCGRQAACEAMIAGRGTQAGTANLGVFLRLPDP